MGEDRMLRFYGKMGFLVRFILLVLVCTSQTQFLIGQSADAVIDLDLISKKKVRQFIVDQHIDSLNTFTGIEPSWHLGDDINSYNVHEKTFVAKGQLEEVWECYKNANPVDSWDGHIIDFGLLISKYSSTFLYASQGTFSEIDTGQVYFLNLRLLKGIYNLPVAFEIINIDSVNRVMEFSYIEGNITQGKQTLQFSEDENHTTQIVHRSYFKSSSKFRDRIYPTLHKKVINDFHRNMRHILKASLN